MSIRPLRGQKHSGHANLRCSLGGHEPTASDFWPSKTTPKVAQRVLRAARLARVLMGGRARTAKTPAICLRWLAINASNYNESSEANRRYVEVKTLL